MKTGNREFSIELSKWVFNEKSVIKSTLIEHSLSDSTNIVNSEIYKVKDNLTYSIFISEWNGENWIPFEVPSNDKIQLEFTMLDPYHRLNLSKGHTTGVSQEYKTSFIVPDQHGIFTFYTNYKRSGLSFIEEKRVVTIRHLANDEYTRSWDISNSWVYLTGSIVVIIGWFIFTILFLFTEDTKVKQTTKKEESFTPSVVEQPKETIIIEEKKTVKITKTRKSKK